MPKPLLDLGDVGLVLKGVGDTIGCAAPPQGLPHPHAILGDLLLLALLGAGLGAAGRRRRMREG